VVVMCLAHRDITEARNSVSAIVANRKTGQARQGPLPNPTAIGTLPVIAVIGAAFGDSHEDDRDDCRFAPFFRPADGAAVGLDGLRIQLPTAGLLVRIRVHERPANRRSPQ